MVCVGLFGCKHVHRSAGGYFLLALMIAGTLLGLRILLYIVANCLQGCRSSFTSDDGDGHDEIEMQARNTLALQQYYRQQLRRPAAAAAATSSSLPGDEWQSKLVIAAGCDHVSFIAQPCPLRTNDVVA